MPARAAWKGFLKVSQLSVPVKAFTATRSDEEISLNQLHRDCGQRVRQIKLCPTHGELPAEQIVSGYKLDEQNYLPIEESELEALRPEDDKSIQVDAFVTTDAVDPVYHSGRTYYLVPEAPPGQRPFCVLRDGMLSTGRHAIARVVISRRELLVLLRPHGRLVAMTVLEYAQRVRPASDYESDVAGGSATPAELQLMGTLMESLTRPDLDLGSYRDTYVDGLDTLIATRMAAHRTEDAAGAAGVTDDQLIAALRASLASAGVDPTRPPPPLLPSVQRRSGETVPDRAERKTG
jgi:DNA end-binding protein Ku